MLPSSEARELVNSDSEPSSPECETTNVDDAVRLIAQGKRDVVCNDISAAVECFQEACRLLAAQYGDFGDEVGEAYLHYGKALLDLARDGSSVIGGAVPGAEAQQNDDEDDCDSDDNSADEAKEAKPDEKKEASVAGGESAAIDSPAEQSSQSSDAAATLKTADIIKDDSDGAALLREGSLTSTGTEPISMDDASKPSAVSTDKVTDGNCSQDTDAASTAAVSVEVVTGKAGDNDAADEKAADDKVERVAASSEETLEQEAGAEADADDDNEGDKVPPLQLAWEVLEMAKVIFSRHSDKERKLKAADAHQMLGEVSLESEMYDQAIEDFNNCLRIQSEVLGPDDRDLAATHYQLGMAYNMVQRLGDALSEFNAAKKILQERASFLDLQLQAAGKPVQESKSDDGGKNESGDANDKLRRELDEIVSLLPEISAKIDDCEEEAKIGQKVEMMLKASVATTIGFEATSSGFEPCSSTSGAKSIAVNNISNLIRKKKAEPEVNDSDAKKPKIEETCQNGDHTEAVNGISSVAAAGCGDPQNGTSSVAAAGCGDPQQDCAH